MKIRSLNNATVLIQSDECSLLIDPWLVGDLYGGAWSPFATCENLEFLKTGKRLTAQFFAFWGVVSKAAVALSTGIALILLDIVGFNSGDNNSKNFNTDFNTIFPANCDFSG